MEPDELVVRLERQLQGRERQRVLRYDAYVEGNQPLRYMAPAIEAEVGERIAQVVLNWPRMIVDAYENRSDLEGFRYQKQDSGDAELWAMYQANDGDEQSQQAHTESLALGRSYVIVGSPDDEDDPPVMTVEHPLQVAVVRDPKTRRVSAALKRWKDDDGAQWATLYVPDSTITYVRSSRSSRTWSENDRDDHELGAVPVVPLVNRGRMLNQLGVSEFHDIIPIADAANKMATDMMLSGEFHAAPRRWALGFDEEDFTDEDGKPLSTWSAIMGRIWATSKKPSDAQVGQFPESDLAVFHNTIKVLAQLAAQLAFLPQDYMSFTSDNPTSADAIRASEARLVKRCERKHTTWGGGWEQVMRLMIRFQTGEWSKEAKSLETLWRDPSTPTVAQKADATVKLVQAGIIPVEQGREDLGYSAIQRARMAEMDQRATDSGLLGSIAEQIRRDATPAAGSGSAA